MQDLYRDFLPILCALDLNHEGIRYYAHSVIKSEIFQMTRRSSEDRYLHLIAFVTHQYFRLQDNLARRRWDIVDYCPACKEALAKGMRSSATEEWDRWFAAMTTVEQAEEAADEYTD